MRSRSTIPRSAPRDGVDHALGLDVDRAGHDLAGQRQAQLHGAALQRLGDLGLLGDDRLGGLLQRGERRAQRGHRLGAAGLEALGARLLAQHRGVLLGLGQRGHDRGGLVDRRQRRAPARPG